MPSQGGPCWGEPGGGRRAGGACRGPAGAELPACPCSGTQPAAVPGELRPPRPRAVLSRGCACRVFRGCCFQRAAEAGAVGRAVPLGQRGWRTDQTVCWRAKPGRPRCALRAPRGKHKVRLGCLGGTERAESPTGWLRPSRAVPSPGRPCGCRGSPGTRSLLRVGALPLSGRLCCLGRRALLLPIPPVAAGVSCAGRSSSLPRRFGVVWLSNGVGTTEEAWETQKFGLLFFSSPFLKKPLINSFQ